MKIEHTRIVIEVEGEEERRLLGCMGALAEEMAERAKRSGSGLPELTRAGLDPVNARDWEEFRRMGTRLAGI